VRRPTSQREQARGSDGQATTLELESLPVCTHSRAVWDPESSWRLEGMAAKREGVVMVGRKEAAGGARRNAARRRVVVPSVGPLALQASCSANST